MVLGTCSKQASLSLSPDSPVLALQAREFLCFCEWVGLCYSGSLFPGCQQSRCCARNTGAARIHAASPLYLALCLGCLVLPGLAFYLLSLLFSLHKKKKTLGAGKMVRKIKVLVTKPEDLSMSRTTLTVEGKLTPSSCLLTSLCTPYMYVHTKEFF